MEQFVIAIKRESRESAPSDWLEQIGNIEGVSIISDPADRIIRVEGPEGIGIILIELIGEYCHIEPVIFYRHSDSAEDTK